MNDQFSFIRPPMLDNHNYLQRNIIRTNEYQKMLDKRLENLGAEGILAHLQEKRKPCKLLNYKALSTTPEGIRTPNLRFRSSCLAFVTDCERMAYTCQINTCDAGRRPSEAQWSARRALQLRTWLRA